MIAASKAGVAYFAGVFALGFLMGALRVLVVVPVLGETPAVALEIPAMLIVSWFLCFWLIARFGVASDPASRLTMGAVAFGLLMVSELVLSIAGFRRSSIEHFQHYLTVAGCIGLLGQFAFALFPIIQSWTSVKGDR